MTDYVKYYYSSFTDNKTGFKKLVDLPKVTELISGSGDFSKSRSWDSKSHVHSTTSQQYLLQDHSCISIPEEAGQPTNLKLIKLSCPELQSP